MALWSILAASIRVKSGLHFALQAFCDMSIVDSESGGKTISCSQKSLA